MRKCPECNRFFRWGLKDNRTIERAEVLKRNPSIKIICGNCARPLYKKKKALK